MKSIIGLCFLLLSTSAIADTYVNGYVKRDGTYVQPHYRSDSNQYRYDNYSSHGNSNPYTSQQGYQRNEFTTPPAYNQTNPYGMQSNPYEYNR